jgi:tRNA U34 5-methylaminomethyl-2-thiouridine-forming methyltransferase MnmC
MDSPWTSKDFELVTLKTGVISLRSLENRETFHPVTGPRVEASILHVQQQRLIERSLALKGSRKFIIWDVGLGAAANALTAIESIEPIENAEIELHSFDKTTAPLEFALAHSKELGYLEAHHDKLNRLVKEHRIAITPRLSWILHLGDFTNMGQNSVQDSKLPAPDAIIYDPYSPVGNSEMWTLAHFTHLRNRLAPEVPCLLTNYTRSTAVRVTLLLAGFYVGIGSEVGEKAETSIASNKLEMIERPLERSWLERVRISKNSAPMTGSYKLAPISEADFERLKKCPQFN